LFTQNRRFDIVICDPPTFAHGPGPGRTFSAAADLAELAGAAAAVLEQVDCSRLPATRPSCQPLKWTRPWQKAPPRGALSLRVIERQGLPPDFPVHPGFPEATTSSSCLAVRVCEGLSNAPGGNHKIAGLVDGCDDCCGAGPSRGHRVDGR